MQTLVSATEQERRARPRAMNINEFCARYNVGRTLAYDEISGGRLRARKVGTRTLIVEDDAEDWLRSLPLVGYDLTR